MARPKPSVILEHIDKRTFKSEQVLECEGLWAVFYQDKPFNLKNHNVLTTYPGPKYKRNVFSNPGHAHSLCRKLNKRFRTTDFAVVLLDRGTPVDQKDPT